MLTESMRGRVRKSYFRPVDGPAGRTGNNLGDDDSVAVSDTGRTEAFSDGVFAITITLLVLNLEVPEHPLGELLHALLSQWPSYVAFSVSFLYVGIVWLNHHALFRLVRHSSLGLNWANLGVLFGTVLLPFPTAVLAGAFSPARERPRRARRRHLLRDHRGVHVGNVAGHVPLPHRAPEPARTERACHLDAHPDRSTNDRCRPLPAGGFDRMGGDAGSRTDQHHRDDLLSRLNQRRRTEESLGPMDRAHS
jgi:hypothetical protein